MDLLMVISKFSSLGFYFAYQMMQFSLFSADLLQGIGAVMDIRWVNEGKVEVGQFCSAQGRTVDVCQGCLPDSFLISYPQE
jgi:hypothetical protein